MTSLRLGHRMSLRHELALPFASAGSILGLSALELELLLDRSLESINIFYEQNPDWRAQHPVEARGNYFNGNNFSQHCREVKGKVSREKYLEQPQIIVRYNEGYNVECNSLLDQKIAEKLALFKRENAGERPRVDQLFSKRFVEEWEWMKEQQLRIIDYLCTEQKVYLTSRNPFEMKSINQDDVAKAIDYSSSTVSRLVNNLTVQLPTGEVIFAEELIPGAYLMSIQGRYALQQLQHDVTIYENGNWMISDQDLVPILKNRFGIDIARRTVSKYKGMLDRSGDAQN